MIQNKLLKAKSIGELCLGYLETLSGPRISMAKPEGLKRIEPEDFLTLVLKFQHFFKEEKLKKHDKVAICSNTRLEWLAFDVACNLFGVVSVPIYPSLQRSEIEYMIKKAEVKLIVVENAEILEKVVLDLPKLSIENKLIERCLTLSDLSPAPFPVVDFLGYKDVITILFTSGSEGTPKGVPQTNENHLTNLWQVSASKLFGPDDSIFLFLPLAHSFGRLCGYVALTSNLECFVPAPSSQSSSKLNLEQIFRSISPSNPTILPGVPRFFEKIASNVNSELGKKLGILYRLFPRSVRKVLGPLITRKLFGKRIKFCISGGAKLQPEINLFFQDLGLTILEGYGLTETCVATHVNLPKANKVGSVGRALPGVQTRIIDGEILVKGNNVVSGYLNEPELTRKAFTEEGWFRTGDLGYLDEEGFLYVTGRKKEILVLSNGKNVPALKLESLWSGLNAGVSCMAVGDGMDYCGIILFSQNPDKLRAVCLQKLQEINLQLNPFEKIKKILIVKGEPSVENGLLTPTLKIKRQEVLKRFEKEIKDLYTQETLILETTL